MIWLPDFVVIFSLVFSEPSFSNVMNSNISCYMWNELFFLRNLCSLYHDLSECLRLLSALLYYINLHKAIHKFVYFCTKHHENATETSPTRCKQTAKEKASERAKKVISAASAEYTKHADATMKHDYKQV